MNLRISDSFIAFLYVTKSFPLPPQGYWWTGEDSNLRSPQGAADLQSAGFSHSPTRPAESFGTQAPASRQSFGTQLRCPALPTRTLPDRCTGHSAMQKGLVSEDTNPRAFVARNSVRNLAKNFAVPSKSAGGGS